MNREKRKVKFVKGNGSPIITTRQNRNALCKCGSGKKAKHCCGTDTRYFSTKPDKPEEEKVA
jgi:CDGSH-type Zn-finger protein